MVSAMITRADIPLPSHTLRFLADDAFDVVGAAVRVYARQFGAGSNAAAFEDVRKALRCCAACAA